MSIQENFLPVLRVSTLLLLGTRATGPAPTQTTTQYGVVQSIALVKHQAGQTSGVYLFTLRMSNGGFQTLAQNTHVDIDVGDRGQVDSGVLRRYG